MKFQKTFFIGALVSASLFVSCGNKAGTGTDSSTTATTASTTGNVSLSNSFGLLLSQNLQRGGMPLGDLNFDEFGKGLQAGLKNEPYDGIDMAKAQQELQNKSANQPAPKFSAALGVLIGTDLLMQGVPPQDVNTDAFVKSMQAGLKTPPDSVTLAKANQEVQQAMMAAQQKKQAELQAKQGELEKPGKDFLAENGKKAGVTTTASGLQYEVIKAGKGKKPNVADKVKVHYHGTLIDGTVFDSSVDRGEPISFPLGNVIKGWQEGVALMPVGAKYKLYIPHELAYGSANQNKIPSFSTLIFEVELLAIEK